MVTVQALRVGSHGSFSSGGLQLLIKLVSDKRHSLIELRKLAPFNFEVTWVAEELADLDTALEILNSQFMEQSHARTVP